MIFETMDDVLPFLSFHKSRFHFHFHWYENDSLFFHNKGFALSLVFKVRGSGTRKWPNNFGCLTFLTRSSVNVKHDHWSTNICLTPDTSGLWCSLYINGWLLLHWRREKSIKTKDTLTWVQESNSLVASTVDFFPSIPKPSQSLQAWIVVNKWKATSQHLLLYIKQSYE